MKLRDLRIEYRRNPVGLDVEKPRFSWKLDSDKQGCMQKAYQVQVMDMQTGVSVWDSKKTESDQSVLVEYAGKPLMSETDYQVSVRIWDNQGNEAVIQGVFETGLLHPEKMEAEWITSGFPKGEKACPVFFKDISLKRNIKKARIYATALGLYEIDIDGEKAGSDYFAPGWTSYHHRLQVQTYDVTEMLQKKENVCMQITVADGWYKGPFGFTLRPDIYGDQTAALAELHITYEDGEKEVVKTDIGWKVKTGAIRESQIYFGETIDSTFAASEADARPVQILEQDKQILIGQEGEPVQITCRTQAKELIVTPKGELVLDFGQNMSGFVEVHVSGEAGQGEDGQKIVIYHAETLDRDGNFYPDTLRQATSIDTYICNGKEQSFRPHFTFHGFRYIRLD